jgi:integrase/recombinase XerD
MSLPLVLETPLQSASSAFETFCSIRKAEGASPATLANYRAIVCPFLRDYPDFLESPRERILAFITEAANQWSRFTRIKVLRVFCKFLLEESILTKDPTKGIKLSMPGKKADIPTLEQAKEFIKALDSHSFTDKRLRVMLLVALDTGLRRGELCGLRQDDIENDLLAINVRPETSKVRKGRLVPVSPQVFREIKKFVSLIPQEWGTCWLFPSNDGSQLLPENFGRQMRRASKKTGVSLKIHGLRHLCATEFLRQTGNIALTAQLLGHSNISTTSKFYEHLNFGDLQEAHSKANVASAVVGKQRIRKI